MKDSQFADATTLAELQDAKIGVQSATTATQVEAPIAPTQDIAVFDDTTAPPRRSGERSDRRVRH